MRTLKYLISFAFVLVFINCTKDENNFDYLDSVVAPSEVTANFLPILDEVTGDKGLIKITPNAVGAVSYSIDLGDGTVERVKLNQGESVQHKYDELPENEFYPVVIEAIGITGLKTEITKELPVVFESPVLNCDIEDATNNDIIIENNPSISKQVDVTVTAKYGLTYSVYFGEAGNDEPETANNGEPVDYQYQEAGTYSIRIVAMSASSETTECTFDFEVTEISQPLTKAPTPPFRADADVISMYSEKYETTTSKATVDMFVTDWSVLTSQGEVLIEDNNTLVYTELSYAGIITETSPINASGMEYFHVDVWTKDISTFKIKFVDFNGTGYNNNSDNIEFEVENAIDKAGEWVSLNIPLSEFVGVPFSDINQTVISAVPAGTTVFLDNMYFWKEASAYTPLIFDDFEGNGNITTWAGDAAGLDTEAPNVHNESINTSLTVLKYQDTGGQYANIRFDADANFDLASYSTFTLKIYVPFSSVTGTSPNQISLKLQDGTIGEPWSSQTEIIKPVVLDAWQEITFDFANDPTLGAANPLDRTDFNRVVLQVNGENNYDSVIAYIDDFAYGSPPPADTPPFVSDDFEGNGTITTWAGDAAGMDNAFPNPIDSAVEGINYSSTVLKYEDTGGQYANIRFDMSPNFDLMAKSKFTLKIYVPFSSVTGTSPNQISLKLQDGTIGEPWSSQTEIIKPVVLDAWQEITFDFANDPTLGAANPLERVDFNRVVLQVNGENNNDSVIAYIDDFNYHK